MKLKIFIIGILALGLYQPLYAHDLLDREEARAKILPALKENLRITNEVIGILEKVEVNENTKEIVAYLESHLQDNKALDWVKDWELTKEEASVFNEIGKAINDYYKRKTEIH